MSKSVSLAVAASLAVAGLASSVSAATILPNSPTTTVPISFSGTLTLSGATTLNCAVSLTGVVNPGGASASITGASFAPGDWQCGWLALPQGLAWTLTPISSTVVTLSSFGFMDGVHDCLGTVVAQWSNPGRLVFSSTYVPANAGSPGPCYVTGTLSSIPTLSIY